MEKHLIEASENAGTKEFTKNSVFFVSILVNAFFSPSQHFGQPLKFVIPQNTCNYLPFIQSICIEKPPRHLLTWIIIYVKTIDNNGK